MEKEGLGNLFNSRDGKVNSRLFFLMFIIILPIYFNILPRNKLCNNICFEQGIVLKRTKPHHCTVEGGVIC